RGIRHYGVRSDESVQEASLRFFGGDAAIAKSRDQQAAFLKKLAELDRDLKGIEDPVRPKLAGGEIDDFKYEQYRLRILQKHVPDLVSQETLDRYISLSTERETLLKNRPTTLLPALCVTEEGPKPKETFVLRRGSPQN